MGLYQVVFTDKIRLGSTVLIMPVVKDIIRCLDFFQVSCNTPFSASTGYIVLRVTP
jgi:hypothetical protein